MATIVVSHLTQVIYAGTKLVLKSKTPVILTGISFIPVGYRKGVKTEEGIKFGNNIYENAKENQKLVLFYGYNLLTNKTLIPTVIVVNGKNQELRMEMINSYEEMIDNVEFPQVWELTAEGIEKKRGTSLTSEEIQKSFEAFKKLMKRK